MKSIAITGGIGTGKSTVSQIVATSGFEVLNVDDQVAKLYELQSTKDDLRQLFSIQASIDVTRKKIGEIVFNNQSKLNQLNNYFTPKLINIIKQTINKSHQQYLFVDCALVFEWEIEKLFDKIIVIDCPLKLRYERINKRNNLTDLQIDQRISAQIDQKVKVKKADYVIINDHSLEVLKTQVKKLIDQIKKEI